MRDENGFSATGPVTPARISAERREHNLYEEIREKRGLINELKKENPIVTKLVKNLLFKPRFDSEDLTILDMILSSKAASPLHKSILYVKMLEQMNENEKKNIFWNEANLLIAVKTIIASDLSQKKDELEILLGYLTETFNDDEETQELIEFVEQIIDPKSKPVAQNADESSIIIFYRKIKTILEENKQNKQDLQEELVYSFFMGIQKSFSSIYKPNESKKFEKRSFINNLKNYSPKPYTKIYEVTGIEYEKIKYPLRNFILQPPKEKINQYIADLMPTADHSVFVNLSVLKEWIANFFATLYNLNDNTEERIYDRLEL